MWENATKTLKGIALDQKLVARSLPLKLKQAKSGSTAVNATQLTILEDVADAKQELDLKGAYLSEDGQVVTIPVTLSNEGVNERYALYQVGVYAEDPDEGDILYFVAQTDVKGGEIIPTAEESPGYSIDWYFALKVSSAAEIEVLINEAGRLTMKQADLRYAPIISPVLEGTPEAPTASKGTSTKQIATTEFVMEGLADKAEETDLEAIGADLADHTGNTGNPHRVTAEQLGLGNVNNTSDAAKPVSTAQQAALDALYEQLTAYTRAKIADLIGGASTTMDTLKEIEDAIAAHKTVTDALDAAIGKKASAAEFDSHAKDKIAHVTAAERTSWTGKMEKTGDASNATAAFTEATSRANIATGEKLSIIFGKIKKWFTDLKTVAFSGSYTDLSNKPGTMTGASASAAGSAGFVPAPAAGAANRYLRSDGSWQVPPDNNTVYSHPTSAGNKHIPAGGAAGQILRWSADGTAIWGADNNTTYAAMKGATASAAGTTGLVPAPAKGKQAAYFRGDGTWQTPAASEVKTAAGTTVEAALSELNSKILPKAIPKHSVSCPCYITDGYFIFGTVPFPYADLYNLTFTMTGMNNRTVRFEGSRFTLHTPTRSGFDGYTNDSDILYWVNSNKGDSPSCSFEVSGTLKS